jgi:hypothetical protein
MTKKKEEEAVAPPAPSGLDLLRVPFPEHQISQLPRGGITLSYVGHAALTDRLLDADPAWNWEPMAFTADGLPKFDETGGLWIKLTVCGVTRLGYGHAPDKRSPGDREKEVIGDALRNAAMRYGTALDLWHKGDLHAVADAPAEALDKPDGYDDFVDAFNDAAHSLESLRAAYKAAPEDYRHYLTTVDTSSYDAAKAAATKADAAPVSGVF